MLEGKSVDLKLVEKEEIPQLLELWNKPELWGQYESPWQRTKADAEKSFGRTKGFFIQRKDSTRVGLISFSKVVPDAAAEAGVEIGYLVLPGERGKGYCTEAVNLLLDYAFLTMPIARIQAHTDVRNRASQRVMEKPASEKKAQSARGTLREVSIPTASSSASSGKSGNPPDY